jgi:hypothetical protein
MADFTGASATYTITGPSLVPVAGPSQIIPQIYKSFSMLLTGASGSTASGSVWWSPNGDTTKGIKVGTLSPTIASGASYAWDYSALSQFCSGAVWASIDSISGANAQATIFCGVANNV